MAQLETAHFCSTHSDQPAVARCDQCGKPFCGDCGVEDVAADEKFCSGACWEQRARSRGGPALTSEREFIEASEHPFGTGWRLWARSLRPLCLYLGPLALAMACVSWLLGGESFDPKSGEPMFADDAALIFLVAFMFGIALTQVVLSQNYTGLVRGNPYGWALRRCVPWVATILCAFVISMLATMALILPGIYVALRLFWADEFALVHGAGPIAALRESWRLTAGQAGRVFSFQLLAGFAVYPVMLAGVLLVVMVGALMGPLGGLKALGPLASGLVVFVLFAGYGLVHAPEIVRFYGMRAEQSRSLGTSTAA